MGAGLLVQRQGHAPPRDRLRRRPARSARPCWCRRRGRPPSARPSPTRSARCSRCRARPPPAARPRWSACRWRSTASTSRAASTAGRSSSSSPTTSPSPTSAAARPRSCWSRTRSTSTSAASSPTSASPACRCSRRAKVVNMISVCLDTTLTTTKCNRYSFRPLRLRAGAGGGVRALSRQQDGQEVAHRLCRLLLGPVDPRRLRERDQEGGRRGRRHHRHSARHRRHDAVPVQDHAATSTACSASSSARTA